METRQSTYNFINTFVFVLNTLTKVISSIKTNQEFWVSKLNEAITTDLRQFVLFVHGEKFNKCKDVCTTIDIGKEQVAAHEIAFENHANHATGGENENYSG